MRKKWIFILLLVGVILAGFFFIRSKWVPQQEAVTKDMSKEQPTTLAERPSIEAFGLVKASKVMNINIDFPARVRRFYIKEGQKVSLGQALLALDVEEYHTQIRNTEYELQTALYELKKTESEAAQLAAEIAEKEKQLVEESAYELSQVRSDLNKARQELAQKRELLLIKAIPASEVTALEKLVADLNRSYEHIRHEKEEEIKRLKAALALKQTTAERNASLEMTGINMQKERITLLQEKLAMLRKKLNQDFIRNDEVISNVENGVACEIGYAEGDLITIERKVLSLIDLDSLIVKANIAEEFIKDLRLGAEAAITPVADYSRTYQGKVIRRFEVAIKENGETVVPVEISIQNRDGFLLPNFNVDIKIYID